MVCSVIIASEISVLTPTLINPIFRFSTTVFFGRKGGGGLLEKKQLFGGCIVRVSSQHQ